MARSTHNLDTTNGKDQRRQDQVSTTGKRRHRLLVFDGDDTLWETMPLYDQAKAEYARILLDIGVPPDTSLPLLDKLDAENVKYHGFSRTRFPLSLTQSYKQLCRELGYSPKQATCERLAAVGRAVSDHPPIAILGAHAVLVNLRRVYTMVLCTKGDEELQAQRVAQSEMGQYFRRIYYVPTKGEDQFRAILSDFSTRPDLACSIGNSVRSDINPALRIGMDAIWIPRSTWAFEDNTELSSGHAVTVNSIDELPRALAILEGFHHERK